MIVRVLLALALFTQSARANDCDPAEAVELRALLESQESKADKWNLAWRITFTGAAVGTFAVAMFDPFPSLRDGLFVSSGKATLASLNRWFFPLSVDVPAANADACADVKALRAEVARVGRKERQYFWTGHIGGIAVNLTGAAIIWYRQSLGQGLLSIAIGYPIGLVQTYTMTRGAWHRWRGASPTWSAAILPSEDGWQAVLGGTF